MTQTFPFDLSPLIEPALAELAADHGSIDLKPWRKPIRTFMARHGGDAIDGAILAAYTMGRHSLGVAHGRMDDVLPGGRLRKALDELTKEKK